MSYQSHLLRTITDPTALDGDSISNELERRLTELEKVLDACVSKRVRKYVALSKADRGSAVGECRIERKTKQMCSS